MAHLWGVRNIQQLCAGWLGSPYRRNEHAHSYTAASMTHPMRMANAIQARRHTLAHVYHRTMQSADKALALLKLASEKKMKRIDVGQLRRSMVICARV